MSSRKSDSGVVMRMSGGVRSIRRRSSAGVSPVRTATCELRVEPRERAAEVPLDVVVERLQRGDVEQPQPLARRLVQPVEAEQEAASVFPEPVGAWMRTWPPFAIAGQPSSCAGVGASKARSNQARVDVERTSSGLTR